MEQQEKRDEERDGAEDDGDELEVAVVGGVPERPHGVFRKW